MIEWTPRLLAIPAALARKYGRGRPDLADELEGRGNLALVLAAADYDPSRGMSAASWLYARVRWAVLGRRRPRKRARPREVRLGHAAWRGLPDARAAAPDALAGAAEARALLAGAVASLSPAQRRAVWLLFWEGLGPTAAATAAGRDKKAIVVAWGRAKEALREALKGAA